MPANIGRPSGETPPRSGSKASTSSQAATIHRANIIDVNTREFTVDVRLEAHPYSTHFDIPWMSPYVSQVQGEGVNIMPEVGSVCWVCSPSEKQRDSFVLGWTPVQEEGGYRSGRELLNPGDIHFSTRDGNFMYLRRGGIVQVGATPVCQRLYIPIRNIIRDFAENYELSTPAGDLTWLVDRTDEQGDGHRGTLFSLACKEFADDPNKDPVAVLKIGSHGEGNETILSLETRDAGGGATKTKLEISKTGAVKWVVKGNYDLEVEGNYSAKVKGTMSTTSDGAMSFESKAAMSAKATEIHLAAQAVLDLAAGGAKLDGAKVDLGAALFQVVVNTPSFATWVAAVTAALQGPPSPPIPVFKLPIPPPFPYISTKVKA